MATAPVPDPQGGELLPECQVLQGENKLADTAVIDVVGALGGHAGNGRESASGRPNLPSAEPHLVAGFWSDSQRVDVSTLKVHKVVTGSNDV